MTSTKLDERTLRAEFITAQTRKDAAAQETGLKSTDFRAIRFELDTLRKQGILVDLTITGTSLFTRKVTWEELGIFGDDIRKTRLTRGTKFVIDPRQVKRLRSIETRMRQWLKRLSYNVTGFKPWSWIGYKSYQTWTEKWDELQIEFYLIKSDILTEYDHHLERLELDFANIAAKVWDQVIAQGYESVYVEGIAVDDRQKFIDIVSQRAAAKMPSKERIVEELQADYATAVLFGGADITEDELRREKMERRIQREKSRGKADERLAYLEAHEKEAEVQHTNEMRRLEEEQARIEIEAMMIAEADHARARLAEIASPFEEVFSQLRHRMAAEAEKMLTSIRKNGFVRGKIATQGAGLLELFDLMAVHDDHELRAHLTKLRDEIGEVGRERTNAGPTAKERNVRQIETLLVGIEDMARDAVRDLTNEPDRFSFSEL